MADYSDAYQSDAQNHRDKSKGGGLFSGSLAQLMVLFNGLILTTTAYATLNIFVQEMVHESLSDLSTETHAYIEESFSGLEQSLYALGVLVSVSDGKPEGRLSYDVVNSPIQTDGFDVVLLLSRQDEGQWNILKLLSQPDVAGSYDPFLLNPGNDFIQYIASKTAEADDTVQLIANLKGAVVHKNDEGTLYRPVALVRALDGGEGYIIGFTQMHSLWMDWIERQHALSGLTISYKDNFVSFPLYKYLNKAFEGSDGNSFVSERFEISLAGTDVSVFVDVNMSDREAFLKNIPMLLLLFGFTLTLIGTLYVRNNQSQSLRLSEMNKQLAQKNYDLNTQVRERERLNGALRKAERENRAIIDSVSDIIFETDINGNLTFLNDTWEKVTGYPVDQSLEKNLFELLYPQDQEEQRDNMGLLVKGRKQAYRSFTRLRVADGDFRSVELAVSMLRHDENRNMHVVGTITDIEERRRTEKALSEAEKKYRTIVENAAGGIYQMSADGRYLSANPAMARIFGYGSPQEMLRDITDANSQLYKDSIKRGRYLRELEDLEDMKAIEIEATRKDGQTIWVNESARAVFDEENKLLFYEGSIDDITKRKLAEMNLKDAKMQSDLASRAKSEFLTNMSHELRTPLNAIIGFSEIIKNEAFGPVGSAEYMDYAKDIYNGGKRLLNIINEILDVSRIEAGDRVLSEGVVSLRRVTESCLELMGPKIEANDMVVENTIPEDFPNIIGEELAVKQMLMNLLSNAVKFTSSGGRVSVSAEQNNSGGVRLSVTDTGMGLDEDEIEKAMSPFGQVESTLNRSGSGTGLGLTLVDSLIKLHEGQLELFSQKGIGTTATLIFPARRVTKRDSLSGGEAHALERGSDFTKTEN